MIVNAMPGDKIRYNLCDKSGASPTWSTVKVAGWQPGDNGGKNWVYETTDGKFIPAIAVTDMQKSSMNVGEVFGSCSASEAPNSELFDDLHEVEKALENLKMMPENLKKAIRLILNDDPDDLEIAAFMLEVRARKIRDLRS